MTILYKISRYRPFQKLDLLVVFIESVSNHTGVRVFEDKNPSVLWMRATENN